MRPCPTAANVEKMVHEELPDLQRVDTPSLHRSAPNLKHRFIDCPGSIDKMAVLEQMVASAGGGGRGPPHPTANPTALPHCSTFLAQLKPRR